MRGEDLQQGAVFSSIGAEQRVPQKHPLRAIRGMVDGGCRGISTGCMHVAGGRGRRRDWSRAINFHL
jgi:hypothetical protein